MTRPRFSAGISTLAVLVLFSGTLWADDSASLQREINGCHRDGTVQLQPRIYLVNPLRLKSDCTYAGVQGKTTLKLMAPNQFIFDMSERRSIRIEGIRFDGSGIGGAIVARENGPARDIRVENCSFTGVSSVAIFPANMAVVSTWALIDTAIRNNAFDDVAAGLWMTTVQNVSLENNTFNRVTQGNAIYIAPNPVPFPSGRNLRIIGNHGSGFARMAVEIFRPDPTNGSTLEAPLIEDNVFSDWTSAKDGFGLSITHGDGAVIRNNIIRNAGRPPQYLGIEVIVRNALVEGNRVEGGFAYGIAVQGTAAPRIVNNRIENAADTGIILACDAGRNRCASHDSLISDNSIVNARRVGIALDDDWAGSRVANNTISRSGGSWPGDNMTLFAGIHQLRATAPGVIESNTIEQTGANPPRGFDFCGLNLTAPVPGSTISNNVVRSKTNARFGTGILDMPAASSAAWTIEKNQFVNLARERS
jgi:parallel beta-helix repeat protein